MLTFQHKQFSDPLPLHQSWQSMEKVVIKTQNINSTLGVCSAFIISVGIGGYGVF